MDKLYTTWSDFEALAHNTDETTLKVITCMMIDYTASRNGISSSELLKELTPLIIGCNNVLGAMNV